MCFINAPCSWEFPVLCLAHKSPGLSWLLLTVLLLQSFPKSHWMHFFYYLLLLFAIHYIIIIIIIIIITVFQGQHFICHWSALQNNLGLRTWNYVELSYIEWLILVGRVGSLERVRESVILLINSLTIVNPRNASMICFIFISFISKL